MKVLENVESICPECFKKGKAKKIDAQIVEEDGKVWIKKECEEHGSFKSIYFSSLDLYEKWMKYEVTGSGAKDTKIIKSPSFGSPNLYPVHKSQSVLTNLLVTNRCNLRCSYCFMNAGVRGYVYEPSLDQLKEMMLQARKEKPVPSKAIQITGGEPTIRDDLFEIIKMAKEVGFTHVQLNTNGVRLAEDPEYCKKLKELEVNVVYLSFDGVSESADPWAGQHEKAIENLRKADLGVVLVPVVIADLNLHELGEIIRYAQKNVDIVRGVNFQPISFAGKAMRVKEEKRKEQRTDYGKMLKAIEEDLDGQIKVEDWYPVPFVYPVSKLVETLKGEPQVEFTASPGCGGATYVFVQGEELIPITRFVDVEGLRDFLEEQSNKSGWFKKARIGFSVLSNFSKFVNEEEAPEGFNIGDLLKSAIMGGSYSELGNFHMNALFLGSMWFQDPWNINLNRLERCVIHYSTPEGIVPFCTYNGLGFGEEIREKHSMSSEEWKDKTGRTLRDDLWKGGPIS